ncbi:MAG TPA: cation:proton antiporter [Gaiellaceae bacterium]|nr:cation:proton antiporter [Gaiellaceae bacterium]
MHELTAFGLAILVVSGALAAALLTTKLSERLLVPAAAPFLVAAAVASDLFPSLAISIRTVERVASVALIVILFDGGLSIGWRRFRSAGGSIVALGVVGTFATAGGATLVAHWALGLGWIASGLVGAAVAPTDPAVMFSVLGDREVAGKTGTILLGESGANDPVGIALMLGMIELATHAHATFWLVVREFALQMSIGLAIGLAGGVAVGAVMRRVSLPSAGLYTLRTLAGAGLVYGLATVAHGSGFLAVFVAGLVVGDVRVPFESESTIFSEALSSLAEIVVFVVLGLTVSISALGAGRWGEGLLLAALLAVVIRPLAVWPLLLPTGLRAGERGFVVWGGLKGAVPILLAALALQRGVRDATEIYELVFVVVLASVVVQGSTVPLAARRLGVEMRRLTSRAGAAP